MKTFGVRVAIVEPGIIDTDMARQLGEPLNKSPYAQQIRFAHLFTASLKNSAQPSLVADKVLEIIESGTWQLRHPVGPDALPFLGWRKSMTDEEWVDLSAADDDTWYNRIERLRHESPSHFLRKPLRPVAADRLPEKETFRLHFLLVYPMRGASSAHDRIHTSRPTIF
jgi:hypothetical protein